MTLIVGLGNPGTQYEDTRHNIGFEVIDYLVNDFGANDVSQNTFKGQLYKASNLLFLKPTTYMNLSGESVQAVKNFYKIDIEDIIVIHDDIDIPFSALRFKKGGGHGGHNGLRSIDALVGKEYVRVRMGVDKPQYKSQVADYVLSDFTDEENSILGDWIQHTSKAVKALKQDTLEAVKSKYSLKSFKE